MEDAAVSLLKGVLAVAKKKRNSPNEDLNVYLAGGMFDSCSNIFFKEIFKQISPRYRKLHIKKPAYPPTIGTLKIVLKELSIMPPNDVFKKAFKEALRLDSNLG